MPHISIQITKDGVSLDQKQRLIRGVTDVMVNVLNKDPEHTVVVITEVDTDNWGVAGVTTTERRKIQGRQK
jgi:4-oxalocrotonate tautomerase